jgi:WhiB family transcriptional regulator, redox-sensing transcriptional regulator
VSPGLGGSSGTTLLGVRAEGSGADGGNESEDHASQEVLMPVFVWVPYRALTSCRSRWQRRRAERPETAPGRWFTDTNTPEATGMDTTSTWMELGNCRHEPPTTFFPSDGVGVELAKRICATCPVSGPCLEYALENRIDHGVWGGTSERQRRRILKARRVPLSVGSESS